MSTRTRSTTGFVADLDPDGHLQWPLLQPNGRRAYDSTNRVVQSVLQALAERGPIEDKSGRATLVLHKHAGKRDALVRKMKPNVFTMRLHDMEAVGLITRDVYGKRTRSIALAIDPDTFPTAWTPEPTNGDAAPVTQPLDAAPPPAVVEDTAPIAVLPMPSASDDINYDALAAALLARCIDAATRNGEDTAEEVDRHSYLAAQLVNAHSLRDKAQQRVRALEQDVEILRGRVMAMKVERDEEKRLREGVEANLSAVVKQLQQNGAAAYQLDDHQRRALSRLISEIPRSPHTVRNVG